MNSDPPTVVFLHRGKKAVGEADKPFSGDKTNENGRMKTASWNSRRTREWSREYILSQ